jgi:hypothetical protein
MITLAASLQGVFHRGCVPRVAACGMHAALWAACMSTSSVRLLRKVSSRPCFPTSGHVQCCTALSSVTVPAVVHSWLSPSVLASCALPSAQSVLLRPVVLQDISGPDRRRRRCHRHRRRCHHRCGRRRHRRRRRLGRRHHRRDHRRRDRRRRGRRRRGRRRRGRRRGRRRHRGRRRASRRRPLQRQGLSASQPLGLCLCKGAEKPTSSAAGARFLQTQLLGSALTATTALVVVPPAGGKAGVSRGGAKQI